MGLAEAPPAVRRYLRTRAVLAPWTLEGCQRRGFAGAVVIPAFCEEGSLFATLESLCRQPPEARERFLVVVVVNNRADASLAEREENRRTLEALSRLDAPFSLAWVDAASAGREIPPDEGVGTARRIGCDLALERLGWDPRPPLLACLDADTLVDGAYLSSLLAHFSGERAGGATIPFAHQQGETPQQQEAIVHYELFLRGYVLGLSLAGSPYAYHSIGSAIACRANAYVAAGGMNRRLAGEDFYFLQQLAKTSGVAPLRGTVVRPSARPSARTPFGTGRSVSRQLAGAPPPAPYPLGPFRLLEEWLRAPLLPDPMASARAVSARLAAFLERERFPQVWERLRRNNRGEGLHKAFHDWFDALKTFRLIHDLCAGAPLCRDPGGPLVSLLEAAGLPAPAHPQRQLEILRRFQGAGETPSEERTPVRCGVPA